MKICVALEALQYGSRMVRSRKVDGGKYIKIRKFVTGDALKGRQMCFNQGRMEGNYRFCGVLVLQIVRRRPIRGTNHVETTAIGERRERYSKVITNQLVYS